MTLLKREPQRKLRQLAEPADAIGVALDDQRSVGVIHECQLLPSLVVVPGPVDEVVAAGAVRVAMVDEAHKIVGHVARDVGVIGNIASMPLSRKAYRERNSFARGRPSFNYARILIECPYSS